MRARGRPRTHKPPGTARHGHGAGAEPRWQRRHLRTFKAAHRLTQGPLEGLPLWLDAEAGPCGPSWGDLGDTPINRPDRVQTGRDSVPGFVQRAERAARSEAVSEGQTAMLGQGTGDPGRGTAEAGRACWGGRACSGTRDGGGGVGVLGDVGRRRRGGRVHHGLPSLLRLPTRRGRLHRKRGLRNLGAACHSVPNALAASQSRTLLELG